MAKRGLACSVLQHMEQVVSIIKKKKSTLCEICLAETYSILPTLCNTKKLVSKQYSACLSLRAPAALSWGEWGQHLPILVMRKLGRAPAMRPGVRRTPDRSLAMPMTTSVLYLVRWSPC